MNQSKLGLKLMAGIVMLVSGLAHAAGSEWTGVYAGAAIGATQFDARWTTSTMAPGLGGTPDATSQRSYSDSDLGYNAYLGYGWQLSDSWVIGMEADFGNSNAKDKAAGVPGCSSSPSGCVGTPGPAESSSTVKMGWNGSIRARLGYLLQPDLMLFGAAGMAWQRVTSSLTCRHSPDDPLCLVVSGNPFTTVTNETTRRGWTASVGLEKKLAENWLIRGQYTYANFGKWGNTADLTGPAAVPTVVDYDLKLRSQALSLGLTYKF